MSKDSSIKVFAENVSGTRPTNAIPVWIDNISAIGGGGGGNPEVESYVTTNSGKIDDVCTTVQTNSASWGGGGGSTGASIPLRITYSVSDEYGNKYTNYYLSSDGSPFVFTAYDEGYQPADLMINGNNYSWSYNNGRWEILHSINGQENVDAFYNAGLEYSGKNIIHFYADNITPELNKVVVNTSIGSITGEIILYDQYNMTYFSSFTGSWSSYIPTSYNGNTITSYGLGAGPEYEGNDFGYTIDVYQEANGGSTINSADIFPSTDNLNPGSRYILAWNTNNGGLYWGT